MFEAALSTDYEHKCLYFITAIRHNPCRYMTQQKLFRISNLKNWSSTVHLGGQVIIEFEIRPCL